MARIRHVARVAHAVLSSDAVFFIALAAIIFLL